MNKSIVIKEKNMADRIANMETPDNCWDCEMSFHNKKIPNLFLCCIKNDIYTWLDEYKDKRHPFCPFNEAEDANIGDEVWCEKFGERGVITKIPNDEEDGYLILWGDGTVTEELSENSFAKTGHRYEAMVDILERLNT